MHSILLTTSVLTAFLGGAVALFAPCCVSVMLPAFFATSLERRRDLVPTAGLFALGVGLVILPIALGASGLSRLVSGEHLPVFLAVGLVMVAMGLATLAGWRLPLPMAGGRPVRGTGPVRTLALGAFSGVASACCAPVLAGVVALSGAAGSFLTALVLGVAYVFGMVAPLFAIVLVWDRRDWGQSFLLKGRALRLRAAGRTWALGLTSAVAGALLVAMGVLVSVIAFTGPSMSTGGWQVALSTDLQHGAHEVVAFSSHLPGWLSALGVFVALAYVLRRAFSRRRARALGSHGDSPEPPDVLPEANEPAPATSALISPSQGGTQ